MIIPNSHGTLNFIAQNGPGWVPENVFNFLPRKIEE